MYSSYNFHLHNIYTSVVWILHTCPLHGRILNMKVIKVVIIFTILMLPTKGYATEESIQVSCELLYMRVMCSNIITQFLWSDLEHNFILIKKVILFSSVVAYISTREKLLARRKYNNVCKHLLFVIRFYTVLCAKFCSLSTGLYKHCLQC